ncbi:MAG: hypothetical protein PHI98_06200 [Eubacteriales bacterium]|nr:hypothetical protein [Eubacteriales bacterium]
MRHHIMVKWKENVPKPDIRQIEALFQDALKIPGVTGVSLHPNVVDRPNRYDLLILVYMEKDALPAFDASDVHHRWKDTYSEQIGSKAIFDCE